MRHQPKLLPDPERPVALGAQLIHETSRKRLKRAVTRTRDGSDINYSLPSIDGKRRLPGPLARWLAGQG